MQPTRLKLYHNYLSNFDFIDKELPSLVLVTYIPELAVLSTQPKSNKYWLEKNIVVEGLILESLGNQRFLLKKTEKKFASNLFCELTIRKKNLFLFLENCLNSIFLYDHKILSLSNLSIENNLHFYLNNDVMDYFISVSNQFKYSVQFYEELVLSKKTSNQFLYLIPHKLN